jgi:RNase P subunit RPR2
MTNVTMTTPTPVKCPPAEAEGATCRKCRYVLKRGPTASWTLASSIWLHTHGSCGSKRYDYWRTA